MDAKALAMVAVVIGLPACLELVTVLWTLRDRRRFPS